MRRNAAIHEDIEGEQESFSSFFPDLDDVEIRARQILYSGRAAWRERVLTRQDFPDGWILRCGDRFCDGAFDVREFVLALASGSENDGECAEKCRGTRSSPEGRKLYGPCERSWQISARLVRKQGKEDLPASD